MKNTSRISLVFILFIIHLGNPGIMRAAAVTNDISPYSLFKIERSRDADEISYDINLGPNGDLNKNNPIHIYWIKKQPKAGKKA